MKRIIDNTSPTSDVNRACFLKMVKKDEAVMAIIEIADKMEALIDDAKMMILNNCIEPLYNMYVICQFVFFTITIMNLE